MFTGTLFSQFKMKIDIDYNYYSPIAYYSYRSVRYLSIYLSELTSVSLLWWQTSGTVCYDILVVIAGLEIWICLVSWQCLLTLEVVGSNAIDYGNLLTYKNSVPSLISFKSTPWVYIVVGGWVWGVGGEEEAIVTAHIMPVYIIIMLLVLTFHDHTIAQSRDTFTCRPTYNYNNS